MNNNEEKESEYYTILEMLENIPFKKVVLILIAAYGTIGSVVLAFVYWYTKHR